MLDAQKALIDVELNFDNRNEIHANFMAETNEKIDQITQTAGISLNQLGVQRNMLNVLTTKFTTMTDLVRSVERMSLRIERFKNSNTVLFRIIIATLAILFIYFYFKLKKAPWKQSDFFEVFA